MKLQGTSLTCYNEVTKKAIVKIDVSQASLLEDNTDPVTRKGSVDEDEGDEQYSVERSFRITFKDGERISFFADTDAEKERWLKELHIAITSDGSSAPMWAQLALAMIKERETQKKTAPTKAAAPNVAKSTLERSASSQRRIAPPTLAEETAAGTPDREMRTSSTAPRPQAVNTPVAKVTFASAIPRTHSGRLIHTPSSIPVRSSIPASGSGSGSSSAQQTPSRLPRPRSAIPVPAPIIVSPAMPARARAAPAQSGPGRRDSAA